MSGFPVAAPSILSAATFAGPGEPFFGSGGGTGEATLSQLTMNGAITMTRTRDPTISNRIIYRVQDMSYFTDCAPVTWVREGVPVSGQGFRIQSTDAPDFNKIAIYLAGLAIYNPGGAIAASIYAANDTVTIEPTIRASFAAAAADGTRSSPITLTGDHTMVGNKGYFTFTSGSHKITPPLLFPGAECIAVVNYAAGATAGDLVVTYSSTDNSITVSQGAMTVPIFYVVFA